MELKPNSLNHYQKLRSEAFKLGLLSLILGLMNSGCHSASPKAKKALDTRDDSKQVVLSSNEKGLRETDLESTLKKTPVQVLGNWALESDFSEPNTFYPDFYSMLQLQFPYNCLSAEESLRHRDPTDSKYVSFQNPLDPNRPITLCKPILDACSSKKRCRVIMNTEVRNSRSRVKIFRISKVSEENYSVGMVPPAAVSNCPFDEASDGVCRDPYFSAAYDPKEYSQGTVIFIPALNGYSIPGGGIHNGLIILREPHTSIKGPQNLSIFIGSTDSKTEKSQIFEKFKDSNPQNGWKFYIVSGETAKKVKQKLAYPKVQPSSL